MSNEVCFHVGADWLKLVCHSEDGEEPGDRVLFLVLPLKSAADWLKLVCHSKDAEGPVDRALFLESPSTSPADRNWVNVR